jgi:hypothetical protein
MQLEQSPGSCRSHMSYIGRMQGVSFDTYREPSPLGFIMHRTLHCTSSGSLILTGSLIASPHLVTHLVLVLGLSVGRERSKLLLFSVEEKYRGVVNITIQDMWLQHFLIEFGIQFHRLIIIWCDN